MMKYLLIVMILCYTMYSGAMIFNTSDYCEFVGNYYANPPKPYYKLFEAMENWYHSKTYLEQQSTFVHDNNLFGILSFVTNTNFPPTPFGMLMNTTKMDIGNYSYTCVGIPAGDCRAYYNIQNPEVLYSVNGVFNFSINITNVTINSSVGLKTYPRNSTFWFYVAWQGPLGGTLTGFFRVLNVTLDNNRFTPIYNWSLITRNSTGKTISGIGNITIQTQSNTNYSSRFCNMIFLFSNRVLIPEVLIVPSFSNATANPLYNPTTLVVSTPNNTPFFFKDNYFKQWYYVPAISCPNQDTITTNVYALNEKEKCYVNDTLVSSDGGMDFGVKIDLISILYQNNNVSCYAQNISSPYFISCTMNDTMNVGNGWRIELSENFKNTSAIVCSNSTTSKHAELSCGINNTKFYTLVVYAKVKDKEYPIRQFMYNGGGTYPSLMFSNDNTFNYFAILLFLVLGALIFPYSPEFSLMSFGFMLLFISYMGLITYSYIYIPILLIVIVLFILLVTRR